MVFGSVVSNRNPLAVADRLDLDFESFHELMADATHYLYEVKGLRHLIFSARMPCRNLMIFELRWTTCHRFTKRNFIERYCRSFSKRNRPPRIEDRPLYDCNKNHFAASTDVCLNSLSNLLSSNAAFRALPPADLLLFSS